MAAENCFNFHVFGWKTEGRTGWEIFINSYVRCDGSCSLERKVSRIDLKLYYIDILDPQGELTKRWPTHTHIT